MRLRWVYTDLPFLPVGTQCVINNRIWNEDQVTDLEVGQLPPEEADFVQDERWALPAFVRRDHICNAGWLTVGEPWPTTLPDTVYTAGGLPVCCCPTGYTVHADEETACQTQDDPPTCLRWLGVGPVSGKQWIVVAPQTPGEPFWRVLRRKNGLPTFYTWALPVQWDGRGTSAAFVLNPPVQPGAPVPELFVTEIP